MKKYMVFIGLSTGQQLPLLETNDWIEAHDFAQKKSLQYSYGDKIIIKRQGNQPYIIHC